MPPGNPLASPCHHSNRHTGGPKSLCRSSAGATTVQPYSSAHAQLLATLTHVLAQPVSSSKAEPFVLVDQLVKLCGWVWGGVVNGTSGRE